MKHKFYQRSVQQAAERNAQLRALHADHHEESFSAVFDRYLEKTAPQESDHGIPAIRGWNLDELYRLRSLAFSTLWEGPVMDETENPTFGGLRGFWAVKPRGLPIVLGYHFPVMGWVELTGKVIEHQFGWRAETCIIRELVIIRHHRIFQRRYDLLEVETTALNLDIAQRRLEEQYHCDVHIKEAW